MAESSEIKKSEPVVLIGTSGWSYKSWSGSFFPSQLPNRLHLDYYSQRFSTTELNGVFYRTPTTKAVRAWAEQTPPEFVFAWKASKFITHWKRLGPKSGNSLSLLESRLRLLKSKAGPVLFQLPPQFQKDITRLASFLKHLRKPRPYVFEFRHQSAVTAPHVYIRAHGPSGNYRDHYAPQTLTAWARRVSRLRKEGHSIYVYFDNDQKSAAPLDAARLMRLMHLE